MDDRTGHHGVRGDHRIMSSHKPSGEEAAGITETDLVNYLQRHPDFFTKHPELLSELDIPHLSGEAVSLVERQVNVLRDQNQQMSKRMHELIEIARQNEELAQRMHQLALTLMSSADPREIFSTLYDNLKKNFHADKVVVRIFAEPAFIDFEAGPEFVGRGQMEEGLFKGIVEKQVPLSGHMKHQQRVFLFGDDGDNIASSVLVPLNGFNWSGILSIGSFDAERFQPGMGVELLANLGDMLSLIIKTWVAE